MKVIHCLYSMVSRREAYPEPDRPRRQEITGAAE